MSIKFSRYEIDFLVFIKKKSLNIEYSFEWLFLSFSRYVNPLIASYFDYL